MNNKVVDPMYSMLLGHPWFKNTKVIHEWAINMVTINGMVKTISICKYLNGNVKKP
jgi:hypothetical protein